MKKTRSRIGKLLIGSGVLIILLLIVPPLLQPVGLTPAKISGASIRVYGANVWGFRGYFAIHTWIATRSVGEQRYRIHQVIGWRLRRTGTALTYHEGDPNTPWFGNDAILLHELTGADAEAAIPAVRKAIKSYPFAKTYTMFPGPNSNSFTEWVAQEVPELGLQLPAKAIGRLWMRNYYATHSNLRIDRVVSPD
ncbi:MAG: hypothetical protein ACI9B8_003515 [Sulfitobacter sp.]